MYMSIKLEEFLMLLCSLCFWFFSLPCCSTESISFIVVDFWSVTYLTATCFLVHADFQSPNYLSDKDNSFLAVHNIVAV